MGLSIKVFFFLLMVDLLILTFIRVMVGHLRATASCHEIMSDALQSKKGYVNFNNTLLLSLSVFFLFEAQPLASSLRST